MGHGVPCSCPMLRSGNEIQSTRQSQRNGQQEGPGGSLDQGLNQKD